MWQDYREVLAWQGITEGGVLYELYLSLTGTWTIIRTESDRSCAQADGLDYMIPTLSSPPVEGPET